MIYQEPVPSKGQLLSSRGHPVVRLLGPELLLGGVLLLAGACGSPSPSPTASSGAPSAATTSEPSPSPSPAPTASETPPPPTPAPTPTPPSHALRDLEPGKALQLLSEFHIPRSSFGVRMAFSPVRPILYHNGAGLQIEGYDFEADRAVFQIQGFQSRAPFILAVSPDGSLIVAEDGTTLGIWDLATARRIGSIQMPGVLAPLSAGFVANRAFYADDESGNLALWETVHWAEVARFSYQGRSDGGLVLPGAEAVVMLIRDRGELSIVDWTGQLVRAIPVDAQPWRLHGISPQGDRALLHVDAGLGSEGLLITDLTEGGSPIRVPLLNIRAIAISPDWRTLAMADGAEILRLVDPITGEPFYSQQLEALQIHGLAISPDGTYLGVYLLREGEEGGWIQIWGRGLP